MASKKLPVILLSVGGLAALICCGGTLLLGKFGFDMVSEQIQVQVQTHPDVQERVGTIESFKLNLSASADLEDEDEFAYDVEGSKGSGQMIVKSLSVDADTEEIISARLIMSDGEIIELDIAELDSVLHAEKIE